MDGNNGAPPPPPTPHRRPHPSLPPHPIYGYPVDPSWNIHHPAMMHPHQMPPHHGYHPPLHPGMEGVHLPSGIPGFGASADPLESILGPFPCVRLKGLPLEVTVEDVLIFFQGFVILDIVLVPENQEAFVIFTNPMDYQMALARDRQTLGRQIVEVTTGTRADYYAAIAKQHSDKRESGKTGKSGGAEEETAQLTEVLPPPQGGYPWPLPAMAAPTQALTESAVQGMPHPGGRGGGGRGAGPPRRTGGGIQVGEHTGFLRMRGLPFTANKNEIIEFFSGYNVIPESIVLTYRNDGRATGEGYIGFASPDDSKAAMVLHRNTMGSRYIELFISNKEEHSRAFARFGGR